MTLLRPQQTRFCELKGELLLWAAANGFELTSGFSYDPPVECPACKAKGVETIIHRHVQNSWHYKRLADDFNLFVNGIYQRKTEAYLPIGERWESLDPLCTWGGRFPRPDGVHFSYGEKRL